jgi:hypothetical protein
LGPLQVPQRPVRPTLRSRRGPPDGDPKP